MRARALSPIDVEFRGAPSQASESQANASESDSFFILAAPALCRCQEISVFYHGPGQYGVQEHDFGHM